MHLNSLKKKINIKTCAPHPASLLFTPDPVAAERLPVPDLWDLSFFKLSMLRQRAVSSPGGGAPRVSPGTLAYLKALRQLFAL